MKVFISYASVDRKLATEIADLLAELGIHYYFDQKDIVWGEDFNLDIREGLADSSAQIVILSPASLKSQWVPYEVGFATALGKQVLPYLTHPSLDVPGYLQSLHYVFSLDDVRSYLSSLLNSDEYKKSAEDFFLKGKALIGKSEYSEALRELNKALEIDPNHFQALSSKGYVLMETGSYKDAIETFLEAKKINPNDEGSYINLGVTYNNLQKFSEAIPYLEKALKINPNNVYALMAISISTGNLGDHDQARKYSEKIVEIDPMNDMAWSNMGYSNGELGDYEKAIEYCRKALSINHENSYAKVNLSRFLTLQGKNK
jgi:tetratricopeptide (TPR) repeat protein